MRPAAIDWQLHLKIIMKMNDFNTNPTVQGETEKRYQFSFNYLKIITSFDDKVFVEGEVFDVIPDVDVRLQKKISAVNPCTLILTRKKFFELVNDALFYIGRNRGAKVLNVCYGEITKADRALNYLSRSYAEPILAVTRTEMDIEQWE